MQIMMMNMMTTINNSSSDYENDDDQSSFKIFIDLGPTMHLFSSLLFYRARMVRNCERFQLMGKRDTQRIGLTSMLDVR